MVGYCRTDTVLDTAKRRRKMGEPIVMTDDEYAAWAQARIADLEAQLEATEEALLEVDEILGTHIGLTPKTSVEISAIRIKRRQV